MCTPVYGRKFVKASQFTMCRRFFLFVSFYNATDPWLLSVSLCVCVSATLSFSFYVCVCVPALLQACGGFSVFFLSVPTGMAKHFQAHSFIDLLSMLYIFFLFSFSFSFFSSFFHFCVFYICLVLDAREAIRRVNIRCSCSHSQFISLAGWQHLNHFLSTH